MLNDMNDVINAGLRYLGYGRCNGNEDEMREVLELLLEAKQHWRTMDYSTIEKLTSGDVDLSQNWNGAAMRARAQRPTLAVGFAWAAQEADALPLEPTDQPLDAVVTETETLVFS